MAQGIDHTDKEVNCKACGDQIVNVSGQMAQCANEECSEKPNFGLRGSTWRLRCPKCGDWRIKHLGASLSSNWECMGCGTSIKTGSLTFC